MRKIRERWRFSIDERWAIKRMREKGFAEGMGFRDADILRFIFERLTGEQAASYMALENQQRSHDARWWKARNVLDGFWGFIESEGMVKAGRMRTNQANPSGIPGRDVFKLVEPPPEEEPLCFCPGTEKLAAGVPGTVCETCWWWKAEYIGKLPPGVDQGRLSFQRAGGIPHVSPLIYGLGIREVGDACKFRVHFFRESDRDAAARAMDDLDEAVLGGPGGRWRVEQDWRLVKWTVYGRPPRGPGICALEPRGSTWVHGKLHALALSPRTIRRRVEPYRHAITAVVDALSRGHILPPTFEWVEGEGVLEAFERRRRLKAALHAYEALIIPKLWLRGLGRPDITL